MPSAPASERIDSRPDTWRHIHRVRELLQVVVVDLLGRALDHDQSKLISPEVEAFDEATLLEHMTYGSPEYHEALAALGPALKHHYSVNRHHPEFHPAGIAGMSLLDLLEMLVDWKAASERHADGDILRSIFTNAERFEYGAEMTGLLVNTAKELGWLDA